MLLGMSQDAWGEVMQSCICGTWKKLFPQFVVNFKGFNMTEKQSVEQLKWLMLGKKVGQDDDVNSLLLSIGEELLVEELEELEQQQCQLEEEVERESTLMEVSMMHLTVKNLQELFEMFNGTMDYMEDLNPNVELYKV